MNRIVVFIHETMTILLWAMRNEAVYVGIIHNARSWREAKERERKGGCTILAQGFALVSLVSYMLHDSGA
jgi:hypothetical protein